MLKCTSMHFYAYYLLPCVFSYFIIHEKPASVFLASKGIAKNIRTFTHTDSHIHTSKKSEKIRRTKARKGESVTMMEK